VLYGTPAAQQYGLESLTWAERVICGPLIRRQYEHGPRVQLELEKYGPRGTARLYSARAFTVLLFAFGVLTIPMTVVGGIAEAIPFCLAMLNAVLGVLRSISAKRARKKWRSENPGIHTGPTA
jgi:hypothetical protein